MANPFGENLFNPSPAYGQVAQMQELSREAPISGAPIPGTATSKAPVTPGGAPPIPAGPMSIPFTPAPSGAEYYQRLANTWRALARTPGASEQIRDLARTARQRQHTEASIAQQVGH